MSQENVDLARRYYELLNAHDFGGCAELLAPEFELVEPTLPDGGVYRGREGFLRWAEGIVDALREIRWEPEQLVDRGDFVVASVRIVARGRQTAIEQVAHRFQVIQVRDKHVVFATGYGRLQQAFDAVEGAE